MDETKEPALYDLDKTGRDGAETEREVASKRLESHGSENSQAHASKFKLCSKSILDHWLFTTVMTLLTIYALFGDDLRLLATSKADDPIFFSLSIICLFAFTLEIGLGSYVKEGYWLGFFFWLDVIATVSLIPDIGWIWDPIIGNDSDDGNNAGQAAQLARAGRASRAGTRAGRIIRILRVIRLIRIVKLYKLSQEARALREAENEKGELVRSQVTFRGSEDNATTHLQPSQHNVIFNTQFDESSPSASFSVQDKINYEEEKQIEEDEDEFKMPEESKVGQKLSELTTRRVIMLVLGMMFGLPLFLTSTFQESNDAYQFGLEVLDRFKYDEDQFQKAWDNYIDYFENKDIKLVYLEIEDYKKWEGDIDPDELRQVEKNLATISFVADEPDYRYKSVAIFDLRFEVRLQSGLSMLRTIFVCIVLATSSILLSNDASKYVLGPIESMITKVKKIAANPLEAVQDEEREAIERELAIQENPEFAELQGNNIKDENMETVVLEKTLTKIGALLVLGFGEAGAEIIAANMQNSDGGVDPMIPGKKINCIFGFCDIRNFTDTTEILKQEVMVFVNEIAVIVHSIVNYFSGAANKNIGDAFLLAWKFPDECLNTQTLQLIQHPFVQEYADMSIISFCKIHAAINKDPSILKYRYNEKLNERMPNYSVKIGFGLHIGWAIEGAIGSAFKIDASYLSPNVNVAAQLEGTTKQFGVPILISGPLQAICSQEMKQQLRQIDNVYIRGYSDPMGLYTCDLDLTHLPPGQEQINDVDKKKQRVLQRIARDKLRKQAYTGKYHIAQLFYDDEDMAAMRADINFDFFASYAVALKFFSAGEWSKARNEFLRALEIKGSGDGPTDAILLFMEEFGNHPPSDWKGVREVSE